MAAQTLPLAVKVLNWLNAIGVMSGAAGGTTPVELAASASVAAAANNQTLAGAVGKRTYIAGFSVDGLGATAASVINVTVTGLLGGTLTRKVNIPAGATVTITPLVVEFGRPLPASADNTDIVVNVPSFGAGNTQGLASAHGFQL